MKTYEQRREQIRAKHPKLDAVLTAADALNEALDAAGHDQHVSVMVSLNRSRVEEITVVPLPYVRASFA